MTGHTASSAGDGDGEGSDDVRETRSIPRGRRRRGGSQLSLISWRDIPAQLTARVDGDQHKVLLHARFQHAIDRAAGVAGLTSTDDYVREWRTSVEPLELGGDAVETVLARRCADLEAEYPRDRLEALVADGGLDASGRAGRSSDHTDDAGSNATGSDQTGTGQTDEGTPS